MTKTDSPWRRSSYSGNQGGACLEVRDDIPGAVPVRDSKVTEGPILSVSASAWSSFLDMAKR
ncbi:DUF397 domain-containing protein [Streptomyces sedi]|uniref:DUF397 domain-containing protein n=1 Tax=Streptomyces sedi TaxID=555059 RepID=A0A5C4UQW9_9ACTN|nr:DUF397 domain-containing protein [Streptomyces sedi]TNM25868.1 DUF397 domain-containing protein [Streptomyces sedi]